MYSRGTTVSVRVAGLESAGIRGGGRRRDPASVRLVAGESCSSVLRPAPPLPSQDIDLPPALHPALAASLSSPSVHPLSVQGLKQKLHRKARSLQSPSRRRSMGTVPVSPLASPGTAPTSPAPSPLAAHQPGSSNSTQLFSPLSKSLSRTFSPDLSPAGCSSPNQLKTLSHHQEARRSVSPSHSSAVQAETKQ